MAEVATKKSINVVSSKKSNEVCSVQSNNGLIDLDNITASNNQLISLCDNNEDLEDDLVLANNTRNELDSEDKSLQELIESELALRICSSASDDVMVSEEPEEEPSTTQPEPVKRIVLDRREDPLDVNAEFIIAETEHCALIEEPYTYQNGHVSPQTKTGGLAFDENSDPDPLTVDLKQDIREVEEIVPSLDVDTSVSIVQASVSDADRTTPTRELDDENRPDRQEEGIPDPNFVNEIPLMEPPVEILSSVTDELLDLSSDPLESERLKETSMLPSPNVDKFQEEEVEVLGVVPDDVDDLRLEDQLIDVQSSGCKNVDLLETWPDQVSLSTDGQQAGQFSDNFDETLCQQNPAVGLSRDAVKPLDKDVTKPNDVLDTIASANSIPVEKCLPNQDVSKNEDLTSDNPPTNPQCTKPVCETDEPEMERNDESKEQMCLTESKKPAAQVSSSPAESETSPEAASTREFLDIERRVLSEEFSTVESASLPEPPITGPTTSSMESAVESTEMSQQDTTETTTETKPTEANPITTEVSPSPDLVEENPRTLIESTEVHVSETNVTILSETRYEDASEPVSETKENLDSWMTVEEATKPEERSEDLELGVNTESVSEPLDVNELTKSKEQDESVLHGLPTSRAPLATPDGEPTDVTDSSDSESREETITTSSTVVTSTGTKTGTKTKKKKIEGVAGNDASSPNLTPRTKKTKKSKKSELEKENISVNGNPPDPSMRTGSRQSRPEMIDFSDEDDLSNVNVKSLTQNYVSEANRAEQEKSRKERIATGVSIKQLCRSFGDISNMGETEHAAFGKTNRVMDTEEKARSMGDLRLCERGYSRFFKDGPIFTGVSVKALRASYCSLASIASDGKEKDRAFEKSSFNKFDALSKKTVLHVRSVDAAKVQQQLNAVGQNGDTNPNCRSCGKVVFQMEQTKAEGLVWHKNCFRCVQCSKQLNVDNYESHESTLYCKAHFKELFQPKPVEESDQPVRPRKPEMIIRENEPKELPPDVVRASDKPDLGLEELSSLNVKSRFQVFEKAGAENANEIERSPSQIAVKRSPSILSKLAKFQAKGMDIGVADESLNGIPYEESSESEEEEEAEESEEAETEIVKSKRTTRERPISFSKMDDIKNRWESTSQQGRRETQREARKEEIAGIRSRLFMGKQGKMKEMYQQAVAGSERVTKINAAEEIQHTTNARSIKERFERGEPIAASDDETDSTKPKPEKADEEVIAAGISRKSRSLFLELDATAAKTGRPVTPVNPTKTPADAPRRARDAFMARQVSDDVVRSTDTTEEVHVETSDISNKFKFFESYKEPEKQRKQFRITPPRDGQVKMDSPDREIYRDPEVVRAEDRVSEVVHTDTARKMLSIFRQMEEKASKEELPDGPKPLKRFTPPPEDKYARQTASDSEEEEDEEGEESEAEESIEEKDPNYVRASDKVEDEFLKQAQNAARAKTLRAKFEHWEETDGKASSQHVAEMEIAQSTGEQSSIESASSLRARFESLGSQPNESPRTPKVKVNRFVEIQTNCMDVCESCQKKVYPLEKVETNNKIFHKQCFRCLQCNCILRMDTFTLNNGKLYCIPHFKQLFITRGNYDEGFGVDPHKNKWATNNANNPSTPPPIAVSNGDV